MCTTALILSISCVVEHEDVGGQCERSATTRVCGLAFCEVHGAEKNGALHELCQDTAWFLECFDNPRVPNPANPEALRVIDAAASELTPPCTRLIDRMRK